MDQIVGFGLIFGIPFQHVAKRREAGPVRLLRRLRRCAGVILPLHSLASCVSPGKTLNPVNWEFLAPISCDNVHHEVGSLKEQLKAHFAKVKFPPGRLTP